MTVNVHECLFYQVLTQDDIIAVWSPWKIIKYL